jgi:hypothetical protein
MRQFQFIPHAQDIVHPTCAKCGKPGTATDYLVSVHTRGFAREFFHGSCLKHKPKPKSKPQQIKTSVTRIAGVSPRTGE